MTDEVTPTGRTIDGEVGEVRLNIQPEHAPPEDEAPDTRIADALAATLGVETNDLRGWSVIVEYANEDGSVTIRTLWAAAATPWQVRGYAHEMLKHTGGV